MSLLDTSAPGAKFPSVGTRVAGVVVEDAVERQQRDFDDGSLLFWDDGNPRMQLVVTIDTGVRDPMVEDDDGHRTLYVKGDMLRAVREACRRAGVKAIKQGGKIAVTFVREEPLPKGKRGNPKKIYAAEYLPPSGGSLLAEPVAAERAPAGKASGGYAGRSLDDEPPF